MTAAFYFCPELRGLYLAGKHVEALPLCQQLLAKSREQGSDDAELLQHLEEIAELYYWVGQFDQAIAARQEMLTIHSRLAGKELSALQVKDLSRIGFYHHCAGQEATAEDYLRRGIELVKQLPDDQRREHPVLLLNLGNLEWHRGQLTQALSHLLEAWRLHVRPAMIDGALSTHLLSNLAHLLLKAGKRLPAKKAMSVAIRVTDSEELPPLMYLTLANMYGFRGMLQAEDNERDAALASFNRALEILSKNGLPDSARRIAMEKRFQEDLAKLMVP